MFLEIDRWWWDMQESSCAKGQGHNKGGPKAAFVIMGHSRDYLRVPLAPREAPAEGEAPPLNVGPEDVILGREPAVG